MRRATFYKHFADKADFFAFVVKEVRAESMGKQNGNTDDTSAFYAAIIRSLLEFLDENERLVSTVWGSSYFPVMIDIVTEQTAADVKVRLIRNQKRGKTLSASPEVLAQAFTGALVGTSKWWVKNRKRRS